MFVFILWSGAENVDRRHFGSGKCRAWSQEITKSHKLLLGQSVSLYVSELKIESFRETGIRAWLDLIGEKG
jgi:hypothetical protein